MNFLQKICYEIYFISQKSPNPGEFIDVSYVIEIEIEITYLGTYFSQKWGKPTDGGI